MDVYGSIWIIMLIAYYGVPFSIGLSVSSCRKAILLAIASFVGLYLSIWSTLGPLFLPLAIQLVTHFELSGILIVSFAAGAAQAALIASAGFASKSLFVWVLQMSGQGGRTESR